MCSWWWSMRTAAKTKLEDQSRRRKRAAKGQALTSFWQAFNGLQGLVKCGGTVGS